MSNTASSAGLDINRLDNVYKAATGFIRLTGANPNSVYGMKLTYIHLSFDSDRRPFLAGWKPRGGKTIPLGNSDEGEPITMESFQRALLRAIARTRFPEIAYIVGQGRCERPATSCGENGNRCYPCPYPWMVQHS
jgi:hypothetical protein